MNCNFKCLECEYSDCININAPLTLEELTYPDFIKEENTTREQKLSRARNKRYLDTHKEEHKQYNTEYYKNNRKRLIEYSMKWQKENRLRHNAQKKKRYHQDIETSRQKQREYRKKVKDSLPHCNECSTCTLVTKEKGEGTLRVCGAKMRIINSKVISPRWCPKREMLEV